MNLAGELRAAGGDVAGLRIGIAVELTEADGIALATSAVSGGLTLNSGGAITQSGTLTVGGASTLTATGDINLAGSSSFTGDVKFNGGANVAINDIKSDLNITNGSSATGNLAITSAGVITDGGTLTVGGNAGFTGTSATLDGLAVTGTVGVSVTGDATLVNATGLALSASSIGGNLSATATTGDLTDTGVVSVGGNATFTTSAANADIVLDQTTVFVKTEYERLGKKFDLAAYAQRGVFLDRFFNLIILAGRPSMGKTALATNIAFNAAKAYREEIVDGRPKAVDGAVVGFFSLEMSAEQLATRMLSEQAQIPSEKIRKGELISSDFDKVLSVSQQLEHLNFFIDDTPALSIAALRTRARRLKRTTKLGMKDGSAVSATAKLNV